MGSAIANRNGFSRISNELWTRESLMIRGAVLTDIIDPRRDIDKECGYPASIVPLQYRAMYDREGIAARVVNIYPDETFTIDPELYETEDPAETTWERAWNELNEEHSVIHYIHRIDQLSGVAYYGVMLFGLDDGKSLDQPVDGINDRGEAIGTPKERKLLYIRTFDESQVRILRYESDTSNPRYGLPTLYMIRFVDPIVGENALVTGFITAMVHWTRVLHIADNRKSSEVYGTPRMQNVFNRLWDLRKILSGSGEMFWKGAFPGYSFEVDPNIAPEVDLDKEALRAEFSDYSNGLQRYLALTGVTAKSLAPQVSDPTHHVGVQLLAIAISIGSPKRIFMGTEEARLSSTEDSHGWNKKIAKRQTGYINPMVLRPCVKRFQLLGVLPPNTTSKRLTIYWPDLNTMTDEQKADIAVKRTTALVQYVSGMVETIVAPMEFLVSILGIRNDEAEYILEQAKKNITATGGDGSTNLKAQAAKAIGAPNASGDHAAGEKKPAKDTQSVGVGGA